MSARRPLIVAALAAGLLALLTVLVAARVGLLLRIDSVLSVAARRLALAHPVWRASALAITTTGGPAVVTVAAVMAVVTLVVAGRRRAAVFVVVTMLGSTAVRMLILNTVARPRPAGRLAGAAGFSFPSGHTTGSAAAALTALVLLWPLLRDHRRAAVATVLAAWAVAVGVSRVALVVHWPTDVVGGWLLAITVVAAATPILGRTGRAPQPGTSQSQDPGGGVRGDRAAGDDGRPGAD